MTNNELTSFERKLLSYILSGMQESYLGHLDAIKVSKREHTGVGEYIDFEYFKVPSSNEIESVSLGASVYIDLPQLKHGAGCILSINEGCVESLELFSHGEEEFPKEIFDFKLSIID
ncbi:hypothetical protein [Aliikangiella sp. IMCC44632]